MGLWFAQSCCTYNMMYEKNLIVESMIKNAQQHSTSDKAQLKLFWTS